jgi:hypothetical protein
MSLFERERTSAETILYALYLYFLGLSFRNTSRAIQSFGEDGEGRSHVATRSAQGDTITNVTELSKEYGPLVTCTFLETVL